MCDPPTPPPVSVCGVTAEAAQFTCHPFIHSLFLIHVFIRSFASYLPNTCPTPGTVSGAKVLRPRDKENWSASDGGQTADGNSRRSGADWAEADCGVLEACLGVAAESLMAGQAPQGEGEARTRPTGRSPSLIHRASELTYRV